MTKINVEYDLSGVVKKLADVQENFNLPGLLKAIGLRFNKWVTENFDKEGELVGGWEKLKPATIARRRGGSSKILKDTGRLRQSFDLYGEKGFKSGLNYVEIGTQTIYSKMHNFGYPKKNIPARRQMPTPAEAKSLSVKLAEARIAMIRSKNG